MIIRTWTGKVAPDKISAFEEFGIKDAIPKIKRQEGCVKIIMGKNICEGSREYQVITIWKDLESMKGFAGEDWNEPVMLPGEKTLLDGRPKLEHYNVAEMVDL